MKNSREAIKVAARHLAKKGLDVEVEESEMGPGLVVDIPGQPADLSVGIDGKTNAQFSATLYFGHAEEPIASFDSYLHVDLVPGHNLSRWILEIVALCPQVIEEHIDDRSVTA